MTYQEIPGDRLLPQPSILKKIEAIQPRAAYSIMNIFEKISRQRRGEETRILTPQYNHQRFTPLTDTQALNRDFAIVGDDIRAAIIGYIEKNNLAEQLNLTPTEKDSLAYVAADLTTPTFRKTAPFLAAPKAPRA